jgi:hypothetical protein
MKQILLDREKQGSPLSSPSLITQTVNSAQAQSLDEGDEDEDDDEEGDVVTSLRPSEIIQQQRTKDSFTDKDKSASSNVFSPQAARLEFIQEMSESDEENSEDDSSVGPSNSNSNNLEENSNITNLMVEDHEIDLTKTFAATAPQKVETYKFNFSVSAKSSATPDGEVSKVEPSPSSKVTQSQQQQIAHRISEKGQALSPSLCFACSKLMAFVRSFVVETILKEQIIDEQILESVPLQRKSIYRSFCRPHQLSNTTKEKAPTEQNGQIDNIVKATSSSSNPEPPSLPHSSSLRDQLLMSDSVPMIPNTELIVQLLLLWKSSLPWKVSNFCCSNWISSRFDALFSVHLPG